MERDYRVRAYLHFDNEGAAIGLFNHIKGLEYDAVDINADLPNAEIRHIELCDHWQVVCNLCFPPNKKGKAIGLYNHLKNTPSLPSSDPEIVCGGSLERCGHRIKERCEFTDKFTVKGGNYVY